MEKYFNVLKKSPLFKQIKERDIFTILKCLAGKIVHYKKDKIIFLEGDIFTSVGIILSGSVHVTNDDIYGNRTILAELKQGSSFGESFAYANLEKIPVSVIAREESYIFMTNCKNIIKKCSNNCIYHNTLIENMVTIIARKIIMQNEKLIILSRRSTREKILTFLSMQSKQSRSNTFKISFNRQELADYLSVDRSAMSTELGKMRDEGLIDFYKNSFKLTS